MGGTMDLYATKGPALPQKLTITAVEFCLIILSAWIMFGSGEQFVADLFGFAVAEAPPARRWVILAFSCTILVRMAFMMFYLMKRNIPWSEAATVRAMHYAIVGYSGDPIETGSMVSASGGGVPVGRGCIFDTDHDEFEFAYGVDEQVYGHTLRYSAVPPAAASGTGCSNAQIRWTGSQHVGAEFTGVFVDYATPTAAHFLLFSLATADMPVPHPAVRSGCRLLVDTGPSFLGTLQFQTGVSALWRLSLPTLLPPITLHFQDWILDGATLASTQRLSVPVVR